MPKAAPKGKGGGGGGTVKITVDLGRIPTIPARITKAERACLKESSEALALEAGRLSGSKRIAATTRLAGIVGDKALVTIGAGVPFARIRDSGGTIKPRSAKGVLRFADGTFARSSTQKGNGYIKKAANRFPTIVKNEFHEAFVKI